MALSTRDVFTLKGYSAQQDSAAELWLLQQQLQGAVISSRPGPQRDAAMAEMIQLSMLIEDQL